MPRAAADAAAYRYPVAVALAIALYYFLFRSSAGYAVRVVGINPHAARYAGMNVGRNIMLSICISGAMAGLAGAFEIAGVTHRLYQNISPGYGFEGIAVALLANNNPIGAIFSGGLFAVLRSGSELMQITAQAAGAGLDHPGHGDPRSSPSASTGSVQPPGRNSMMMISYPQLPRDDARRPGALRRR